MKFIILFTAMALASARPDAALRGYPTYVPPPPPPPPALAHPGYNYPSPVPVPLVTPLATGYDYPVPHYPAPVPDVIPTAPIVPDVPTTLYGAPSIRYAPRVLPLGLEVARYNVRGHPLPLRTLLSELYAQPSFGGERILNPAPHIIDHNVVLKDDGTYDFDYLTSHGINHRESGLKGLTKSGTVSFNTIEGIPIGLSYEADHLGFRAEGAHLPVPVDHTPEVKAATFAHAEAHANAAALTGPLIEPALTGPLIEPALTGPLIEPALTGPLIEPALTGPLIEEPVRTLPILPLNRIYGL